MATIEEVRQWHDEHIGPSKRPGERILRIMDYLAETGLRLDQVEIVLKPDMFWECRGTRDEREKRARKIGGTGEGGKFYYVLPKEGA